LEGNDWIQGADGGEAVGDSLATGKKRKKERWAANTGQDKFQKRDRDMWQQAVNYLLATSEIRDMALKFCRTE